MTTDSMKAVGKPIIGTMTGRQVVRMVFWLILLMSASCFFGYQVGHSTATVAASRCSTR